MNKSNARPINTRSVMSLRPYLVISLCDVVTAVETFFISLSVPLILLDDETTSRDYLVYSSIL